MPLPTTHLPRHVRDTDVQDETVAGKAGADPDGMSGAGFTFWDAVYLIRVALRPPSHP